VRTQQGGCQLHTRQEAPAVKQGADKMKKVVSLFLIAVLISGCNRTADNVSSASQPLTVHANPVDELCGSEKNADLYFLHVALSAFVNVVFLVMVKECSSHCAIMFITMLRMVSAFSFPVYACLTNPSFLSKSKLSLASLAVDTCLSLYSLITKNPSVNFCIGGIQGILELFRFLAYPNVFGYLLS
jgi:hypothetical protein